VVHTLGEPSVVCRQAWPKVVLHCASDVQNTGQAAADVQTPPVGKLQHFSPF
jgi:hypothetical protein